MEMKGFAGGFYRISEWIMRLSVINLLWLFCSLPVVVLTFLQFLAIMNMEEVGSIYVLAFNPFALASLAIAPFTFFPSTAAMFSVARKWVTGDADVPLFRSFFRYFKENYRVSLLGGLVFELLYAVFLINFQFYSDQQSWLGNFNLVFLVFLALLAAVVLNFFCYVAHFDMPFRSLLRNSVLITVAKLPNTITILVINGLMIYISLKPRLMFLLFFFTGSAIAMFTFWSFHRMIAKIQEKMAGKEEAAGEGAETEPAESGERASDEPEPEHGERPALDEPETARGDQAAPADWREADPGAARDPETEHGEEARDAERRSDRA